jgi:hypothetical protein
VLFERAIIELSSLTASVTLFASLEADFLVLRARDATYTSAFGFFFFLRMAVAVSFSCGGSVSCISDIRSEGFTSLCSAPDGSLRIC